MEAATVERGPVLERLWTDFPLYGERFLKILPKKRRGELTHSRKPVAFVMNEAQRELDRLLAEQRANGLPQRAIVLKARRVGISTYVQGRLIQRATLADHHNALVVAHDTDTSSLLFAIGKRMYDALPREDELKPPLYGQRRGRFLHFADEEEEGLWPDSTYSVDTAGDFEGGRGAEYESVHASEFAFWPKAIDKLVALTPTLPDGDPDSLFVIESTANGHNAFKEEWDRAEAGDSEFIAFFWPWWKQAEYTLPFANEAERENFKIGELPYGEDEPALVDPGPIDPLTGEHVPLTLEQLHWRRMTIANVSAGRVEKFKQEYPATPAEAFLMTGRHVYDQTKVAVLIARTVETDPKVPSKDNPGPIQANLAVAKTQKMVGRQGPLDVPSETKVVTRAELPPSEPTFWKIWPEDDWVDGKPPPTSGYVIGVDVSEGIPEGEEKSKDPAYHAIEVINHKTGRQVAEYRSRVDEMELAEQVMCAALFFNDAWVAVEKTGFYGTPIVRRLYHDYHYMFTYKRKASHERTGEKESERLGWDTNRETKPILIAGVTELLREGTTGIMSRGLAYELQTYIRNERGKMMPEPGKFADRKMAWAIAKQVALEKPFKPKRKKGSGTINSFRPRDPRMGY